MFQNYDTAELLVVLSQLILAVGEDEVVEWGRDQEDAGSKPGSGSQSSPPSFKLGLMDSVSVWQMILRDRGLLACAH